MTLSQGAKMDPAMAIEVAAMSGQRALEEAIARGDSEIQRFYRGCNVFITGGTGFLGKQLIEKLLRACEISKIFVLLRPKKGKQIQQRLEIILEDPVFEVLRKHKPSFEKKIVAIEGDVAELGLGISVPDWKTITDEVDVIYHVAATTRFNEPIQTATMINVRGTRETIILGKACKKLKSFVHVSTAFCTGTTTMINQEVYEQFYPTPLSSNALISMAESMEVERLNSISSDLIKGWPNTYTFTKAVAEDLVRTTTSGMPICIVRPGIVVASYREPSPGWMDISCAYGGTGILVGSTLGVLHGMLRRFDKNPGFVPCEYVNNATIAAGKEAEHSTGGDNTKIYAISTTYRNACLLRILIRYFLMCREITSPKAIYYNFLMQTSNKSVFFLYDLLFHRMPAYIVDFVCLISGKERRFTKIYKKVYNLNESLSYFALNNWMFVDKNLENLYKNLSKTDKMIFNFDVTDINWLEYMRIWVIGTRKYIIKDGLKDTAYAIKKQSWFRILHYIVCTFYGYGFWKLFCVLRRLLTGVTRCNATFAASMMRYV